MDSAGDGLLPGEGLLWRGASGRARIRLADAGLSLYILAVMVLVGVEAPAILRGLPPVFIALAVIAWGGGVIQSAAMLVSLLVLRPITLRRSVYEVTDERVLVTTGLRRRRTWSAYLDQVDEPVLRGHRDGTADLLLQVPAGPGFRGWLAGSSGDWRPFRSVRQPAFPVLRSLADADAAAVQQALAAGRPRAAASVPDTVWPVPSDVSAAVALEPGERLLWTGQPDTAPWWFGGQDIYLSVFGSVWLVFVGLIGAVTATHGSAAFLVFLVPFAAAGGLYPAAGRVLLRRIRIKRSAYLLTDRRLVTVWQWRGDAVVVQASLDRLLPPVIWSRAIVNMLARPDTATSRNDGWKSLLWPAATTSPPVLVGIRDSQAVRDLICAAELALRTPATFSTPAIANTPTDKL